jgi:tRNA modification GTPase
MEADIDFAEDLGEGFENTWRDLWLKNHTRLISEITRIMKGFASCEMIREGYEIAIIGAPNVGKSSILNRFLGKERAIVTELPGTTRDFIEEGLLIQGLPFRIIDTAGLRVSDDPVERLGTQKALDRKEQADLILLVMDASRPLDSVEISLLEGVSPENTIVALNKSDLAAVTTVPELIRYIPDGTCVLELSAKTGKNWHKLTHHLTRLIRDQASSPATQTLIPVNQRHVNLLGTARDALKRFHDGFQKNVEEAYLASDLWEAKSALEAITGKNSYTDILSEIFSNFCVGK